MNTPIEHSVQELYNEYAKYVKSNNSQCEAFETWLFKHKYLKPNDLAKSIADPGTKVNKPLPPYGTDAKVWLTNKLIPLKNNRDNILCMGVCSLYHPEKFSDVFSEPFIYKLFEDYARHYAKEVLPKVVQLMSDTREKNTAWLFILSNTANHDRVVSYEFTKDQLISYLADYIKWRSDLSDPTSKKSDTLPSINLNIPAAVEFLLRVFYSRYQGCDNRANWVRDEVFSKDMKTLPYGDFRSFLKEAKLLNE